MSAPETWKAIPSLPGYLACDDGRVMVAPHLGEMPHGGPRHYGGQPTYGVLSEGRYGFYYNGKNYRVARLICEAFNGTPPEGAVCMHLDENPLNNRADNLQWGTQKENLAAPGFVDYMKRRGKVAAKINEEQARHIKYGHGTCRAMADKYGLSPATISNIRAGRSWAHV